MAPATPSASHYAARLRRADTAGGAFYVIRVIDPDGRVHPVGPN